ncbi:M61 family metallopeptidase [Gallaecimonas xiamenensis]|uniref:Aminopeptidase n=1 Tax=Gallaecimonas xiamenensis 3-C-1 TaxID=745411 RepID=K2JFV1_9GAMM|nr:PDZ domain-containing protein [Gallaecimonas xiamenensis]EKE74048.1 aminopeptidase [Gallaecimonas xiamenensis 3-C-1]
MKPLLPFLFSALSLSVQAEVQYQMTMSDPAHHLAEVEMTQTKGQGSLDLMLPVWRTGRYEILDQANSIRALKASIDGVEVPVQKVDKSTWRVDSAKAGTLKVSYQLYANRLGDRLHHIDDSHAFIDASGAFLYSADQRQQPLTVNLSVPQGWNSVSGMEKIGSHGFKAPNYDVLIDSPIETGLHKSYEFQAGGKDYQLVIWGEGNYDGQQMADDLEKMVTASQAIWQGYPFDRYVFMVHATNGERGATEHLNSTIIQTSRYNFAPRESYLRFLATAAHEFVHTWNVKAYRGDGLVPYDYQQENYASLLWLAEGSTSYFQNQLLLRSGLMTPQEYFKVLGKSITAFKANPGRFSQSVSQASFDSWIEKGGDYGHNFSVNIYSEGALVSWLLDADLLKQSANKVSYRDLHQRLFAKHAIPATFDDNTLLTELKDLSGKDYGDFWAKRVKAPLGDLDFDALLDQFGLALKAGDPSPYTGLTLDPTGKVLGVDKGSPAWQAGLSDGDLLVAVDGLRLQPGSFEARLKDFKTGQSLALTFFRRDQLQQLPLVLAERPADYQVEVVKKPSRAQKAAFKAWLGIDLPKAQ